METQNGHPALPDNPFEIPELPEIGVKEQADKREIVELKLSEDNNKKQWGPVLVEKRPNRIPKDGRAILEKARTGRKKLIWKATNV
jgi:hypothetical protein